MTIKIRGVKENNEYQVRVRIIKDLRLHQQGIPETLLTFDHLKDLNKEEVCYETLSPGILIGTDHWKCIVSRKFRISKLNEPAASKTRLGWVVHRTAPRSSICAHL